MKLLDLFCGAGLASWGYWRSGRFSEVVGVDLLDMPYAFDFVRADAYNLSYEFLSQFDFIHASPPCQFYSKVTPHRDRHKRSIPPILHMLYASGIPHVVENVEGSGHDLKPNLRLTGRDVGLMHSRPRYFYCSFLGTGSNVHLSSGVPSHISAAVDAHISSSRSANLRIHGGTISRAQMVIAMGLDEISSSRLSQIRVHHIEQGIPPRMTRYIAGLWSDEVQKIG